eukprot:gene3106-2152_t
MDDPARGGRWRCAGGGWLGEPSGLVGARAHPLPPHSSEPPPVAGGCVVRCGADVVLVSGLRRRPPAAARRAGEAAERYSRVCSRYDVRRGRWEPVGGSCPCRVGATGVAHRGRLLLYGGWGPGGLDAGLSRLRGRVETRHHSVWIGIDDDDVPGLAADGGAEPEGYFDEVVELDPARGSWRAMPSVGDGKDFRAAHCAAMWERKGRMVVFGGWTIKVRESVYRPDGAAKPALRYST